MHTSGDVRISTTNGAGDLCLNCAVSAWLMRGDEQIRGSFKTVYEEKS